MPEQNPWWDALSAEWGEPTTKTETRNRGRIAKELRDAGVDPAEIPTRSRIARERWPASSVNVLASRWAELGTGNIAPRSFATQQAEAIARIAEAPIPNLFDELAARRQVRSADG